MYILDKHITINQMKLTIYINKISKYPSIMYISDMGTPSWLKYLCNIEKKFRPPVWDILTETIISEMQHTLISVKSFV